MPGSTGTAAAAAGSGAANGGAGAGKESEASKRARRRAAQKANKKALREADAAQAAKFAKSAEDVDADEAAAEGDERKDGDAAVKQEGGGDVKPAVSSSAAVIEVVAEEAPLDSLAHNPALAEMAAVFERFKARSEEASGVRLEEDDSAGAEGAAHTKSKEERIDDELRQQSGEDAAGASSGDPSRRKQKAMERLSISDLKLLVSKPEVVELHDANSADPKLLVYLKSYRNAVPVPAHWAQKRKYLQNKRGFEKPPFQLPECIENTGISKMRGAQQEKEKTQTNKQAQRAKMQPKMGKIDIDYQILHDAFFRYQTKPAMTAHGELYYEGREHEVKMTDKRPCVYSPALREALGMKDELSPPPWLINMQRFGPPPAYPNLKIPGVSAPIPFGARYGFGEGEWGKPPVDVNGRPLYGDVFGVEARSTAAGEEKIDTTRWGAMESEGEEDDEEEEEEEEMPPEDDGEDEEGKEMDTEGGTASTVSGLTTPELLNLRKADGTGTETPDTLRRGPQQLYHVLEEKKTSVGGAMFGTQHTYVLPGDAAASAAASAQSEQEKRVEMLRARARGQVDVALNPEELEGLDAASLKRKYEAQLSAEQAAKKAALTADDDDEDEEEGGRKKKRKKAGAAAAERNKVYKDFKF